MKFCFSGRYRIEVRDARTNKLRAVREFDNVITNRGLNSYGADVQNNLQYCYVGTGTGAALPTDARMGSYVGAAVANGATRTAPAAPDYVSSVTITYRFPANSVVGNFSEVGVGSYNGDPSFGWLFSRALILDEYGNPSTITVVENEYLDVYYTLYLHPPVNDTAQFSVNISGNTHSVSAKLANASSSGIYVGTTYGVMFDNCRMYDTKTNSTTLRGVTETVDGVVSDTSSGGYPYTPSGTKQPYTTDSFKRSSIIHYGLTNDNYENGISGLTFATHDVLRNTSRCFAVQFQYLISPPIMKTNKQELDLVFEYSWGRYGE